MPVCSVCGSPTNLGAPCPAQDGGRGIADDARARNPKDKLLGAVLEGRFALVNVLGAGMMGTVYEGLRLEDQRRCAVKVLKSELVREEKQRKRFRREAEVISRLSHANLVELYAYGSEQESFIAMEFVDGRPLEDFRGDGGGDLNYKGLSQQVTLHIIRQLLSALAEAHRRDIVHRDLKPENITVCKRGGDEHHIKVLDFGLAKMLEEGEHHTVLTATGEILGTPLYMSPEQATGMHPISHASDVYAVGAMIFELITGKPPFDAPTPLATMMQHVNLPVPEMTPRPGMALSAQMREVVLRCLGKQPADRFASAQDVLTAFEATEEMRGFTPPSSAPARLSGGMRPSDPSARRVVAPRRPFSMLNKPPGGLKR